jgi:hypothetical protein
MTNLLRSTTAAAAAMAGAAAVIHQEIQLERLVPVTWRVVPGHAMHMIVALHHTFNCFSSWCIVKRGKRRFIASAATAGQPAA